MSSMTWFTINDPIKHNNPLSAMAKFISVGSPTIAKSILGSLGIKLLNPFFPTTSSSPVAAIIILYLDCHSHSRK